MESTLTQRMLRSTMASGIEIGLSLPGLEQSQSPWLSPQRNRHCQHHHINLRNLHHPRSSIPLIIIIAIMVVVFMDRITYKCPNCDPNWGE